MRLRIAKLVSTILLALLGAALLAAGVFAVQLGIDNNASWGKGRILAAAAGALMLLTALGLQTSGRVRRWLGKAGWTTQLTAGWGAVKGSLGASPLAQKICSIREKISSTAASFPLVAYWRVSAVRSARLFAGLGVILCLFLYTGYISCGKFAIWPAYTDYFDKLAQAFQHGQLSMLEKPPAELLQLANPYDYHNREGIAILWDASLYQGKYYYYWGPVPALVAWPIKALLGQEKVIQDQYLLFAFCGGLAVLLALTLSRLRAFFFPSAPTWTLLPLTLLGGLAVPVFWLINRPSVYETAIAAGQFFLFLGLYAGLRALTGSKGPRFWLALAGFAWGAAVNARLSLAFAVVFLSLGLAWETVRRPAGSKAKLLALACLGIPLALWAGGMGWYNAARFGSILETGHRYQLTGMALPPNYRDVTSLAYMFPSLYSYLVRPLQFLPREFPFFYAPFIKETMWPWFIRLPKYYYYPEPVAGLLPAVPGVWLAFLPLLGWARRGWDWLNERSPQPAACPAPAWLWTGLVGGVVCLLAPLLVFISTSMRYLADVTPLLAVLAGCGWWWAYQAGDHRPGLRGLLNGAALALILVSVGMSLLVNFTNGDRRFAVENPALYSAIASAFSRLFR